MFRAKEEQQHRRLVTVLATSALMRPMWTVPWRLPWNKFLTFDTRLNSGKMNISFETSTVTIAMLVSMTKMVTIAMNVGFEASTVTIAMLVSITRVVTIVMNVGFEANTITIAMSVSRPERSQ